MVVLAVAVGLGAPILGAAPARAQTDKAVPIAKIVAPAKPKKAPDPSSWRPPRRTTAVKGVRFPGVAKRRSAFKPAKPIPPPPSSQDAPFYQKPVRHRPVGRGNSPIWKAALRELRRLKPPVLKPPPLPKLPGGPGTAPPAASGAPAEPSSAGGRNAAAGLAETQAQSEGRAAAQPQARSQAVATCDPATQGKIYCENQQVGVAQSDWDLPDADAGDATLQGFATDISVNVGQTVSFKIKSTASKYRLDIYRLGYYGGAGARLVATVNPSAPFPQAQPTCLTDATTGLIDCGNWAVSASWAVPATAVSGVYLARLVRLDNGGASHIPFIVRDDSSHSQILLKTSDTTWEAYNAYGGNSLYLGNPVGRAYKVSYNRPYDTRVTETNGWNWVLNAEYPMIRFLEANGYDVSYTTDVDTARRGNLIKNHKIFVSSGHDEYWSQEQRDNVTAARDAGVNLAFFSGNEVYWKTRWEPSTDASHTDFRTIVCYKETRNAGPIDPQYPAVWTGTWRDPTYSPPSNGGKPENSLTGTLYMVDPPTDFALRIDPQYAKLRFWRGTSIATETTPTTLSNATLGYEFDTDPDNGFRPSGLFDLSGQTETVQNKLLDFGATTGPGTVTHHMTTYRAASGALVFGAGTIQWAYGLDPVHDGVASTSDARIRQATVNLMADMGATVRTLQPGLTATTASTDTTAPTTAVTSTAHPVVGTPYTVTGTASDSGGVVAGVEVSTDSGATYHPAVTAKAAASATWSYSFLPTTPGAMPIRVRAVDDSANLSGTATSTLTVDARTCPCSIFSGQTPTTATTDDATDVELGVKWRPSVNGTVSGIRFYKGGTSNSGPHTGTLWSSAGALLASGTFANESGSGWQTLTFTTPVTVTAGTTYVASYRAPAGHYAGDLNFFTGRSTFSAPLLALQDGADGPNGVYHVYGGGEFNLRGPVFPTDTYRGSNYWVDVVFNGSTGGDQSPPSVVTTVPAGGAGSVPVNSTVSASFSKPFTPASVVFTVAAGGTKVPGAVSSNADTLTATFTPTSPLAAGTTFTASVSAADAQGHTLTPPFTWTFSTGSGGPRNGTCPCTVWADSQQPGTASTPDADAVEVGVKIRSSQAGYVTGVRFYKGASNTGVHTGSVWSASGTRLATVTFGNESASGWQQATVDPPVAVAANTTYVVSYHTNVGYYSSTVGYFGAATAYGPLTALADGTDGGDGVFAYGPSSFPASSSGSTNYWVDAVFTTTAPPPSAPRVVGVSPSDGWTGSALAERPRAVFDRPLAPSSVTATLKAGSTVVPGTASYDPATSSVTFVPSRPLTFATTYTVSVSASGEGGVAMGSPKTWSFTTGTPATCPCTLWPASTTPATASADDTGAYELGTRFTSDVNGLVTGVQFYKGPGNVGTHTGSLWTAGGARLATGTFTGETASGWQNLAFASPVAITAGTTYVASYSASAGHYSYDSGYFAADDADRAPLHAPSAGSGVLNGVYRTGSPGFPTETYNATNYWVQPVLSTTTTAAATCPCGLFRRQTPAGGPSSDSAALELGVRFAADQPGRVTGVRFYKSTTNTGPHTGSVWSVSGTRLATGTFVNETATGWQTLTFAAPVTVSAGTAYVASYHTNVGRFYATANFFDVPYDLRPLHAAGPGQNGVFRYGAGGFPNNTFANTNYWVDAVFVT